MKNRLFTAIIILLCLVSSAAAKRKLYVLLAADVTAGENVAASIIADRNKMMELFESLHPDLQQVILVDDMTSKGILDAIKNLPTKRDDAIVFRYIGHGAYDSHGHFFALATKNERLYRTDVQDELEKKKVALRVLMTDSCFGNASYSMGDQGLRITRPYMNPQIGGIPPLLNRLFFETDGVVDFNTCEKDTSAFPSVDQTKGSVFTIAFSNIVQSKKENVLNWDTFLKLVGAEASEVFKRENPHGRWNGRKKQTDQKLFRFAALTRKTQRAHRPTLPELGEISINPETGMVFEKLRNASVRRIGQAQLVWVNSVDAIWVYGKHSITARRQTRRLNAQVTPQIGVHTIFCQNCGRLKIDKIAPYSAAAAAGLKKGDHIVAVSGKKMQFQSDITRELKLIRAGGGSTAVVRIENTAQQVVDKRIKFFTLHSYPLLGLTVRKCANGIHIVGVEPGSPFANGRAGGVNKPYQPAAEDHLVSINGVPILEPKDIGAAAVRTPRNLTFTALDKDTGARRTLTTYLNTTVYDPQLKATFRNCTWGGAHIVGVDYDSPLRAFNNQHLTSINGSNVEGIVDFFQKMSNTSGAVNLLLQNNPNDPINAVRIP